MQQISDIDLLTYLEGEDVPGVLEGLRSSPALRQRLAELRTLETWLHTTFDGIERPESQDMVDVALNQASAGQKLQVAAYERASRRGREEMASLRKEASQQGRGESANLGKKVGWYRRGLVRTARLIDGFNFSQPGNPQTAGVRSSGTRAGAASAMTEQLYLVEELQAAIRLQISRPLRGEQWQVSGMISQTSNEAAPIADCQLILQNRRGGRGLRAVTNALGYFGFHQVKAGRYQLKILFGEEVAVIDGLRLTE